MQTNFAMMQYHNYSLTELENMMPWEREIYVGLMLQYIEEEKMRIITGANQIYAKVYRYNMSILYDKLEAIEAKYQMEKKKQIRAEMNVDEKSAELCYQSVGPAWYVLVGR